jgi:predicted dehydrogenase/nucleoside-diphosphate-sugar epimerase
MSGGVTRICLVGAGSISRVHADAIAALPGLRVSCVVDPNFDAAQRLARDFKAQAFASLQEALAADAFDRAHVLVPPDLHAKVARELIAAGKPVLVEKPLAAGSAECDALIAAAAAAGVAVGVNQNFVHHPAFARLRQAVLAGEAGELRFVSCAYNVPLRQLKARAFGHWMFAKPGNILLEQAVHPLSQIAALAGEIGATAALPGPAVGIAPGAELVTSLDLSLDCARVPAQLHFAVGQEFPFWQVTAICDDGVLVADILANRLIRYGRTRFLEALDQMLSGLASAGGIAHDSVRNMLDYALGQAKLAPRKDPFYLSMKGSIGAFHAALDAGRAPELDAAFGAALVRFCDGVAASVFPTPKTAPATVKASEGEADCVVLGGTGFIGTHLVQALVAGGKRVRVMARGVRNLHAIFSHPLVSVLRGDIRDADSVTAAIGGAPVVVNLAHGGGGADFAAIEAAMVGGAEVVARACQARGVRRLVHVGSIASLYCGKQEAPITGATPPDSRETERGDYARAKVLADRMLLRLHAREHLPVVILRPGLVVGEGTSPFHSGLGFYNTEQHCIGWNTGTNPLPFVLAEDVASAIAGACAAAEAIDGNCYNLVGDVRPSARVYTEWLARALGRPLRYHPQSPRFLWLEDSGKWLIKRAAGRKVAAPAMRDFLSRGLRATFDCADARRDLGWAPVADEAVFIARAIDVHRR